jgi:threonine/homoserine/homoserine lactone efflux protein
MLPLPNLLAFLAAAIVLVVMPGPTVLFVVGRSIALGRRVGLLSVLGNAIGLIPVVVAVAFGVGAIVMQSEIVFTILKFVGAGYLVYLGIQAIRHRKQAAEAMQTGSHAPKSTLRVLGEGFLVGVSNPKSIAFFVAVLPQFVAPEVGWVPGQMLLLGAIFVGLALISDSAWAFAAGTARDWFARSPKRVERLGATGGVMMIGLGGVLALTGSQK